DSDLRVNVTNDGRVLSVLGSPAPDLPANTTPKLKAADAIKAARARHAEKPELVFFNQRLAWRLTDDASDDAGYDVTVDAATGKVLKRVNLVKSDAVNGLVWENHPIGSDAPYGARLQDLSKWLAPGAVTLDGPYVHAYSDIDGGDDADPSEEV